MSIPWVRLRPREGEMLCFPVMQPNAPLHPVSWKQGGRVKARTYVSVLGHIGFTRSRRVAVFIDEMMYHPAYADIEGNESDTRSIYKQDVFELRTSRSSDGTPIKGSEYFCAALTKNAPIQYYCSEETQLLFLVIHTKEREIPPSSFAVGYDIPNEFWNAITSCYYVPRSKQLFKPMMLEANRLRSFELVPGYSGYGGYAFGFGGGAGGGGISGGGGPGGFD